MKIQLTFLVLGLAFTSAPSYANLCVTGGSENPFSQPGFPQETGWRAASSHLNQAGNYFPTSSTRETEVNRVSQAMENEILGIGMPGDTPPIEFISADGTTEKYLSHSNGANHQLTRVAVSNVSMNGTEAVLNGTLLVPASGHTGVANAKRYAKSDTYTVRMETSLDAKGDKFPSSYGDNGALLIDNAKSLNFVTLNEVSIPLVKDHVVRIYYFRSGSGGPGGYFDGRIIDFVWDGTTR